MVFFYGILCYMMIDYILQCNIVSQSCVFITIKNLNQTHFLKKKNNNNIPKY